MSNPLQYFASVKAFAFDVDGVLTNGDLIILENGVMARTMNVKDGYALQLAIKKGYHIAIISGGNSKEVVERVKILGITDTYMNVFDKVEAFAISLEQTGGSTTEAGPKGAIYVVGAV